MNNKICFYEELSFNSHPSLQTKYYDGWLLRFSEGYTNRANSVNMIYPSTIALQEKIEECEKQYFSQGLPCVFKVTDGSDEALDGLLQERGYQVVTPTALMTLDLKDKTFAMGECIITNQVTKEQRHTIVNLLKSLKVTAIAFRPLDEAIVTSGGIKTSEINPKTMESKLINGLYFAGEVIDVDAYTGGFNLQIAFSTGHLAGENAAE